MLKPLSFRQKLAWLRLARTRTVGPVSFQRLIKRFGGPESALEALPSLVRRGGGQGLKIPTQSETEDELAAVEASGARLLASCEPDFPTLLAALDPPPPVITLKGPLNPDSNPCLAIVGARNASALGLRFAEDLARDLGRLGYTLVSGMARGIDGAVHRGSLPTGSLAVLAGGVDHVYPPQHQELYDSLSQTGCLVSEMAMGYKPTNRDFPRRNRLISGLSLGVIVSEATVRSGSLITARCALEQGREVMATPGSPLDPRSKGANLLIQQGASLIETAEDVHTVMTHMRPPEIYEPKTTLFEFGEKEDTTPPDHVPDEAHTHLLELLSPTPVDQNDIIRQTGLPAAVVFAAFVELELAGRLVWSADGRVGLPYPQRQDEA